MHELICCKCDSISINPDTVSFGVDTDYQYGIHTGSFGYRPDGIKAFICNECVPAYRDYLANMIDLYIQRERLSEKTQ